MEVDTLEASSLSALEEFVKNGDETGAAQLMHTLPQPLGRDTALFLAVQYGNSAFVDMLLAQGADAKRLHRRGRRGVSTALHTVFTSHNVLPKLSLVQTLLNHGVRAPASAYSSLLPP